MVELLASDVSILEQQDESTLAEWWSELNRWNWPKEINDPEPPEYVRGGRRGLLMNWIIDRIGQKECLRDWNKDRMPGKEFDDWWDSRHQSLSI